LQSSQTINLPRVKELVIAGWTGRDVAALEKHIRELEAIGVKRPKTTPIFYRVAASLLTNDDTIEALGDQSSGEAECVVYSLDDGLFVGVGSDHTDRKVETVGVSLSKQMCAKPVSRDVWRLEDVAVHWDKLILRSYVGTDGRRRLYQEGSVAAMRPPTELFTLLRRSAAGRHGDVLRHARRSRRHRAVADIRDGVGRSGAGPQDHAQLSRQDAARPRIGEGDGFRQRPQGVPHA
jgi:hypothetical protein